MLVRPCQNPYASFDTIPGTSGPGITAEAFSGPYEANRSRLQLGSDLMTGTLTSVALNSTQQRAIFARSDFSCRKATLLAQSTVEGY